LEPFLKNKAANQIEIIQSIQNRIYEIRGQRVMLDFDLALLYEVETKRLNEAVKRNIKRFPEDFMFRLTKLEWQSMWSGIVTTSEDKMPMRSQIATALQNKRNINITPFAFTEQGVAMLSGILNSDKAINMNIAIMRSFVEIRRMALAQPVLSAQLQEFAQRIGENDIQLAQIYEALENMLDEKAAERIWNKR
jgi:hypothetical protein